MHSTEHKPFIPSLQLAPRPPLPESSGKTLLDLHCKPGECPVQYMQRILAAKGQELGENTTGQFIRLLIQEKKLFKQIIQELPSLKIADSYNFTLFNGILQKGSVGQIIALASTMLAKKELSTTKRSKIYARLVNLLLTDTSLSDRKRLKIKDLVQQIEALPLHKDGLFSPILEASSTAECSSVLQVCRDKGMAIPLVELALSFNDFIQIDHKKILIESIKNDPKEFLPLLRLDFINNKTTNNYPIYLQFGWAKYAIEEKDCLLDFAVKNSNLHLLETIFELSNLISDPAAETFIENWFTRYITAKTLSDPEFQPPLYWGMPCEKSIFRLKNSYGSLHLYEVIHYTHAASETLLIKDKTTFKLSGKIDTLLFSKNILSKILGPRHTVATLTSDNRPVSEWNDEIYHNKLVELYTLKMNLSRQHRSYHFNKTLVAKHPSETKPTRQYAKQILSAIFTYQFANQQAIAPDKLDYTHMATIYLKNAQNISEKFKILYTDKDSYLTKNKSNLIKLTGIELHVINNYSLSHIFKGNQIEYEVVSGCKHARREFWNNWRAISLEAANEYRNIIHPALIECMQNILTKLQENITDRPLKILEICGGNGELAQAILDLRTKKPAYTLLEFNDFELNWAKNLLGNSANCIKTDVVDDECYYQDENKTKPMEKNSLDIVLGSGALTQVVLENKAAAIKVLKKIEYYLQTDGYLVLAGHTRSLVTAKDLASFGFKVHNTSLPGFGRDLYIAQKMN